MKKILILFLLFLSCSFPIVSAESGIDATVCSMVYPMEEVQVISPFGWRVHPIMGDAWFHFGTDFGYDHGRYIHVAVNGIVTYAGWISGYWNTVMISHGVSIETLYGHNQKVLIAEG